jgi:hypothetical protein
MTTDYKILGQETLGELALDNSTAKEQVIYEVPANTQFTNSSTSIVNSGDSSETYSISVVRNNEKSIAVTNVAYQGIANVPRFVAVGNTIPNEVYTSYSSDAVNWTTNWIIGAQWGAQGIAYGNGKFVTVSYNGTSFYSTDGITWTQNTLPGNHNYIQVIYAQNKFVAIGQNNSLAFSENGIDWTESSTVGSAIMSNINSLVYGNGKFVATLSNSYGENAIAYSDDAINWNVAQIQYPFNTEWWSSIYDGEKFICIAGNLTVARSYNGSTWEIISQGQQNLHSYIAVYGDNKFVAIYRNNASTVAYSTNAITWTLRSTLLPEDYYVHSIIYANGKFVIGSSYTDKILYSSNGIDWSVTDASGPWRRNVVFYAEVPEMQTLQQQVVQSLNKNKIIYNKEILPGETHTISGSLTLNSGDQIRAYSTSSDIIVNVYGAELS